MKKIISLILVVLMVFSVTAIAVSAADEKPVKITFVYDTADKYGLAVERTKVIYVDYDEDYTKEAPKDTYISGGYKYYISGWETDNYGPDGMIYENLPTIPAADGITEITYKACYAVEEVTAGGILGDAAEGVLGESTMAFFEYIVEQIKVWFGQFILFLRNFM